jgi:hypothetical protein
VTRETNPSFFVTKAGHALHTGFLRHHLLGKLTVDQEKLAGQC